MLNKKIPLLVMMFVMISFLSKAQYEKGSKFWQVEGTFRGSSSSIKNNDFNFYDAESNSHSIGLSFKRAVFKEDYLAKGWSVDYNLFSGKSSVSSPMNESQTYIHNIGVGYFVDKFKPLSKSLAIYGEVNGKIGYSLVNGSPIYTSVDGNNTYASDSYYIGAGVNFGVRYFLKKNLFINGETSLLNLNVSHSTSPSKQTNVYFNTIMNVSSLSISIGKSF